MQLTLTDRDADIWQKYQGGSVKILAVSEAVGLNRNLVGRRIKWIKQQIEKGAVLPTYYDQRKADIKKDAVDSSDKPDALTTVNTEDSVSIPIVHQSSTSSPKSEAQSA